VELLDAESKEWHGLRRLRLRSLLNANIQGLLIAVGQNLKRVLPATGGGRRHAPCGSRLPVNIDASGGRGTNVLNLAWPETTTPATGGFFNGLNGSPSTHLSCWDRGEPGSTATVASGPGSARASASAPQRDGCFPRFNSAMPVR